MSQRTTLIAFLALGLAAGCTVQQPQVGNPYPPVPPLTAEIIPKPPVSAEALIWQPGHWDWGGGGYVWVNGQYVPAAGHGNLWVQGWWSFGPGGWIWQPAHWTS
jgi:WXXGXW repeat (2 copies)